MTNQQVFKAFANGTEAHANNVRSVKLGMGTTVLYSYGTPIAYRLLGTERQAIGVFDAQRYSVTTSKQRSQAMREFPAAYVTEHEHEAFRNELCALGAGAA